MTESTQEIFIISGTLLLAWLALLLIFKNSWSSLIKRARSVKWKGGEFSAAPDQSRDESKVKKAVEELYNMPIDVPFINELEKRIIHDLQEKGGLSVDGDTNKVLIRHLAATQLLLNFERAYSVIFGSQIRLLKLLNEQRSGYTEETVREYFEQQESNFPALQGKKSEYFYYLCHTYPLVEIKEGSFFITDWGVGFLEWMVKHGKTENRDL